MKKPQMSWEESVEWLRCQPDQQWLVKAGYYDDPLTDAALRFWSSDEWKATKLFMPKLPGKALDLGAGRGIASFALAKDGWQVTALEPDPSSLVGSNAIRQLSKSMGISIDILETKAERLPFPGNTFDLLYGREVLHHAAHLESFCKEAARVLKPGGRFIAVREHVVDSAEDLKFFLNNHPLHKFYDGENAYALKKYVHAIKAAGLRMLKILTPYDVINYYPQPYEQLKKTCRRPLLKIFGYRASFFLLDENHALGRMLFRLLQVWAAYRDRTPGRIYGFIAEKQK